MKRKIKNSITLLLLGTILMTGCEKFLDKAPENVVPKDEINYQDKTLMYGPVSGIYSMFADCATSWAMYSFMVIRSDQLIKGGGSAGDQGDLTDFQNFQYVNAPTFWMNEGSWVYFYDNIIAANSALEALDKFAANLTEASDRELNEQYKAEVRFLRAYTYFFMTRLWGDIPLFTDNKEVDGIFRSPRAEIYEFIDAELAECAAVLPNVHPGQMAHPGAASMYTALGLKAKAGADANNWDAVFDATETIINDGKFELYQDFYQLFKKNALLCSESLFEAQISDFGQSSGIIKPGGYMAIVQGPDAWIDNEAGIPIYAGWGFLCPSDKLEAKMLERNDAKRMETTIMYSAAENPDGYRDYWGALYPYKLTPSGDQIFSTAHKSFNGKVYVPSDQLTVGRPDYGGYNNLRMIRYADILLLNAEARVHKGLNADAPFNEVRRRADLAELSGVTLEQIYEERDMELALEWGERFYDLTRTGRASTELTGYSEAVRFYPIPRSQVDLNPNLALEN